MRRSAVAASLLLHGAALLWLAWETVPLRLAGPPSAEQPVLQIELDRAIGDARSAAAPRVAPAQARAAIVSTARPAATTAAPTTTPAPAATPADAVPIAPPATAAVPGASGAYLERPGAGAGVGPSAGERDALRGLLGCAHGGASDLSPAEEVRCAERLGLASRTAPRFDPIPAEKRAYYDAVAAAYAKAHAPPPNGPRPLGGASSAERLVADQGGLWLPMAVCAMKFGAPRGWKSYHDVPPHSLKLGKLGPLPCFIPPPQGRGTEESGVEAPASLRERTDDAAHMKALDAPK